MAAQLALEVEEAGVVAVVGGLEPLAKARVNTVAVAKAAAIGLGSARWGDWRSG